MILSLPIDAWLLLFVAVGLGLALEVAFYRARRGDRARSVADSPPTAGADTAASRPLDRRTDTASDPDGATH